MAKYFLASVGTAEAFRLVNGDPVLAFRSKTLTDSGLSISTTKDDIRGGTGAPIQYSFYHDPSVEITLTDIVFDPAYIEAQLGADFVTGGNSYEDEEFEALAASSTHVLKYQALALNMGCGESKVVVWYSKDNGDWEVAGNTVFSSTNNTFTAPAKGHYCIRYVRYNQNAKVAEITSEIIPAELFLVITAPIYAGDACSASNGRKAGTITYEVPRFKLNGAQDFTMNMSSNQTMSLAGVALASENGCDTNKSNLLNIITVYDDYAWYKDVEELIADADFLTVGDEPHIYARYKNGTVSLINNSDLTFAPALVEGVWGSDGSETITLQDDDGSTILTETVTIAAE